MPLRFLDGSIGTVMYDDVTMWGFGPVFVSMREARDFANYCPEDARAYSNQQLEMLHKQWLDAGKPDTFPEGQSPHICDDDCVADQRRVEERVMSESTELVYVVTFNPINDFTGLRRMTLEEARRVTDFADEWAHRRARIVNVETCEEV